MSLFLQQYLESISEGARLHGRIEEDYKLDLDAAIWAGDVDRLQELAGCGCCCDEHTFEDCPARAWGGCRGQGTMTRAEREEWVRHYERAHRMTRDQFFGLKETDT